MNLILPVFSIFEIKIKFLSVRIQYKSVYLEALDSMQSCGAYEVEKKSVIMKSNVALCGKPLNCAEKKKVT